MSKQVLTDIVDQIVTLADAKKAEDICVFHVAKSHWLTEYVVVLSVKNRVHGQAVFNSYKSFFSELPASDDIYDYPHFVGEASSGWTIIDANSIVVHCVNQETREFYDIDKLFAAKGDIYYH